MAMIPALDLRPAANDVGASVPANIEAEQALLGALLCETGVLAQLGDFLHPEHFHEPLHARLFEAVRAAAAKGQVADPILVGQQFVGDKDFEELGGLAYLADLVAQAPPGANAPDYARAVYDMAIRRTFVRTCQAYTQAALSDLAAPAFDVVAATRAALELIEQDAAPEDASMIEATDAASSAIAQMEQRARDGRLRGKMTGLRCVDRRLGGLLPGSVIVIGGRPSMGKSALMRAIMHGAAVRNPEDEFLACGIEMGPEEMIQRELSALSHEYAEGVEYQAMAKGAVTPFDFQNIDIARSRVPQNLILDDCPTLSLEDVRRKVWSVSRRARRRGRKLAAVSIDYLQLMRRPSANGRNDSTVLGEITQGLKQVARQAGICIILLSQLSRAVEGRDDKKPELRDLRDSGSIEQDADAVLFPFREFYYVERAEPKKDADRLEWEMQCSDLKRRLDVICAKQRQGPVGIDRQTYLAEYDYIEDYHDQA